MRKVVGARRGQLIQQFLCETVLLALLAVVVAVPLARIALSELSARTTSHYALDAPMLFGLLPGLLALAVFVGLMAGIYPALYFSGFRPG